MNSEKDDGTEAIMRLLFQAAQGDAEGSRPRASGDLARGLVFDDEGRRIVKAIIAEAYAHVRTNMASELRQALSMSLEVHREQHEMLLELIPFIRSEKIAADAKARFWTGWMDDKKRKVLDGLFYFLLMALGVGAYGAYVRVLAPLISPVSPGP